MVILTEVLKSNIYITFVFSYRLNYLLAGQKLNPYHFKVTNLIFHVICSVVILYAYRAMIIGSNYFYKNEVKKKLRNVDFLAALLFAVHPLHTEAVSGVVGRADVLAAITYFTSFICYHNAILAQKNKKENTWLYLKLSLTLAFISMLFKENGVTILVSISHYFYVFIY